MTQVVPETSKTQSRPIVPTMIDISAHAPTAAGGSGDGQLVDLATIALGVICPMASESETAVRFVDAVLAQCRGRGFKSVAFFAVLDNACKDNTRELLTEHATHNPELRVVWAPENRGVVDAYVRGYRAALDHGCDWILEIDAGFSHDPANIPPFFDAMRHGYDCVFGSRFCAGGGITDSSFKRKFISKGGTVLANAMLGTTLSDMTSGFELFSRRALQYVLDERGIHSRGPFFQTEIKTYCRNLKFAEVPIHYRAASHDVGKSALKDSFRNLWRLYRMKRRGEL
jgi:dolichol-phosphate mannosyltransferase